MDLLSKKCVACEGGVEPFTSSQAEEYLREVSGWKLNSDSKGIEREFKFKDFKESISFINRVAEVAESEGHHPDIHVSYNRVHIELSTHSIRGLSENDFILAAKINSLLDEKN
ncbi:MAG: 4a-hydroxytetrahydrobiopterin dehydratase [Patescibacteria group bacterium]|nr:4a-hydroxytetrahydrobiopterin dehydratase [Patescibacteria group bacterium]